MGALKTAQTTMASFLRDPGNHPPPEGVEDRRLKVYQELVYKNIEGFISGGFPVLRTLYTDDDWHAMVRTFIDGHRCRSPYFLEISQEFLAYLMERHEERPCDPPFLLELAHYEWVEMALDVSPEQLPAAQQVDDLRGSRLVVSPLAWSLQYRFPVHRIGPSFQPDEAGEGTFLVVYRNREDAVKFMEINPPTARLLELLGAQGGAVLGDVLAQLAGEMGLEEAAVVEFGVQQVAELIDKSVVLVTAA